IRIGTRPLADLVLSDRKISGLHCEVLAGEALRIHDLGSKNGTYIGGRKFIEAAISPSETFDLGDTRIRLLASDQPIEIPLLAAPEFHGILGCSVAIRALTAQIQQLATSDTTVLVQGETGSGKERVAEALHAASARQNLPFEVVDCGTL